jgi:hypothetical protein
MHQLATYSVCGEEAMGITTIEHRPWDKEQPERAFHICVSCAARIKDRPLDQVLSEYVERVA